MHLKPRLLLLLVAGIVTTLITTLALVYFTRTETELPHTIAVTEATNLNKGIPASTRSPSSTTVTPPAVNKSEAETPTTAKIKPRIDWQKYPGTLADQIQKALDQANGVMAADLAEKLLECKAVQFNLAPENYQLISGGASTVPDDINKAVIQKYQRINSYCQTVSGDATQLRLRLLDVAVKDKIAGAARQSFQLGVRRPDVLQSILHDAKMGDMFSIVLVAIEEPENLGIDSTKQAIFRYALTLAAQESEPKSSVRFALETSESTVAYLLGEKTHKFDAKGLDQPTLNQAKLIAAQLTKKQSEFE